MTSLWPHSSVFHHSACLFSGASKAIPQSLPGVHPDRVRGEQRAADAGVEPVGRAAQRQHRGRGRALPGDTAHGESRGDQPC